MKYFLSYRRLPYPNNWKDLHTKLRPFRRIKNRAVLLEKRIEDPKSFSSLTTMGYLNAISRNPVDNLDHAFLNHDNLEMSRTIYGYHYSGFRSFFEPKISEIIMYAEAVRLSEICDVCFVTTEPCDFNGNVILPFNAYNSYLNMHHGVTHFYPFKDEKIFSYTEMENYLVNHL